MQLPPQVPGVRRSQVQTFSADALRPSQVVNCLAGSHKCGQDPNSWCCSDNESCGVSNGSCVVDKW